MKVKSKSLLMRRICSLLLAMAMVFTSISTTAFAEEATVTEADLITKVNPILKSYDISDANGTWVMDSNTRFVVEATDENLANERLTEVIRLMNAEFVEKQIASQTEHAMVYVAEGQHAAQDILVRIVPVEDITNETTSEEAYKITIGASGVVVEAASENAVIYALRTIQTMMITNGGLVYGEIIDYPDVEERRLHVDCARKYISKDWFIRQIREMSYLKMNTIQIHFSENLGFRIECKTDPSIMSDQYLRHEEVKEILAEAKLYGIKVIPSFDSPGHVDQILKAHPEYGQVNSYGDHYASGLDVTNPEAVAYIYSLYDEYMELFEGCTDFHIGGDEYMEFDRAPFTTQYKSVLDAYARESLGEGYIWKDVLANYINELAEYVHSKGFKPRVWNDGLYYGESAYEGAQKIDMHDYIGIDFWSQMSWNYSIARLQTFINKGHTDIYNFNASYFYYVLRTSKPTDGREQHSFDVLNQDANIYNNWTPGKFQENTISDDAEQIKGAAMGIWCDAPNICDEDTITSDIASELRALACKSWNTSSKDLLPYDEFVALTNEIGNVAGFAKGSDLPTVGNFIGSDELGTLTLRYVDEDGNEIKATTNTYGIIGDEYSIDVTPIYGYRFVSMDGASTGTFTEDDIVVTLTYELYTDKSELQTKVDAEKLEENYLPDSYAAYKAALAEAKELLKDATATQLAVDAALDALEEAEAELVAMDRLELYLEVTNPKVNAGYTSDTYAAYQAAVTTAEEVLYDQDASDAEVIAALQEIKSAKAALTVASGSFITVTANKNTYMTYSLSNILDGNPNTYAWLDGAQTTGDYLMFTFASPVILNSFNLQYPTAAGGDYFQHADVEISSDGEEWTKIGEAGNSASAGITANANGAVTQYVRIRVTQTITNWTQISEATFDYEEIAPVDTTELQSEVDEVLVMDLSAYTPESVDALVESLEGAMAVLNGSGVSEAEVSAALAEVQEARLYLIEKEVDPDAPVDKSALVAAIASAEALEESVYTADTWSALQTALLAAKEVNEDANATREEVSDAVSALRSAQRELKVFVNKAILAAAITAAGNLEEDDYTPSSWSAFSTALNAAREVNANEDATQAAVDKAVADLTAAQGALVEKTDDPTDGSKDLETSKITYSAGSEVEPGNASSTEGGIRLAFDNNTNTYWHSAWEPTWYGTDDCEEHLWVKFDLSEATVVDAIRYLPRPANSRNGDITGYRVEGTVDGSTWTTLTEGTWESTSQEWKIAKFTAVELQGLRLVITGTFGDTATNKFASAAELRVRTATLSETPDPSTVDKTELAAAIEEAEELTAEDYTANSWETLQIALVEAKAVNANVNATQEAVDTALANLTAAQDALENKPVDPQPPVDPVNPFEDVYDTDYYYDPVMWAVENGITDGWTETLYAPNMGCTRGQVVTFLWRAAGEPEVEDAENPFADVAEGAYYYDAVLWAVEEGITDGWTEDTFAPEMTCTRGQIVTFIWRAAGEPEAENAENPFADVAENAYYYDAILWAVENQITDGWTEDTFAPEMDCTRGQIVTFLYRYYN